MSPFSARLTFLGFITLVCAFAANALYMQPPSDKDAPVTGSVERPGEESGASDTDKEGERQPAKAAPKGDLQPVTPDAHASRAAKREDTRPRAEPQSPPSEDTPRRAAAAQPAPTKETVRAIQRELAYRGYAVERRNGKLDQSTRLAILNYQYDTGMALTGRPSEALLEHILFGPFQAAPESDRIARLESDRALVARVQRLLSRLGFGNLPDSGRIGPGTREGLREFATFRDLPPEARLSPRLLLELADVTDEPLAPGNVSGASNFNQR